MNIESFNLIREWEVGEITCSKCVPDRQTERLDRSFVLKIPFTTSDLFIHQYNIVLFENEIKRFSSDCSSFMFHKVTKLCTPGGRLSSLHPIPAVHEGELYILMSDDLNDKFSFVSFNNTTVQLFYFKTEVNYTQALEICRCFDSTLNVAKTNDKYQLFASLVKETKHDTWIGLNDIESEGHFVWVDDKQEYNTSISPSYFQGDQPDNYNNNEDCVMMRWSNLQLNDERCDKTFYFICQKP